MSSALLSQIVVGVLSALISGVSVHLWNRSSGASPAAPATPAGTPAPAAPPEPTAAAAGGGTAILFPNHPIASKALQFLLDEAEQAGIAAAKAVLANGNQQLSAPAPSVVIPAK